MEFKNGIFGNNDEQQNDSGGNAAEITRLATELSEARQRIQDLEAENTEMEKRFKELQALEGKAPEMEREIKALKAERDGLKTELAQINKRVDSMAKTIMERIEPLDRVQASFVDATGKINDIAKSAEILNRAAAEAQQAREQYSDGVTLKDVAISALKYCAIAAFLYGFCWYGIKHGTPAKEIAGLHDMVWRIAYNQIYMPWGSFISPYISRDEATHIINEQYKTWREQQQP